MLVAPVQNHVCDRTEGNSEHYVLMKAWDWAKVQTETSITGDEEVRQSLGQKSHLLEKLKSKMTHESSVLEGLQ